MNQIKHYREKRNMSQSELAAAVGITTPYISLLENDLREPGVRRGIKIAKALKVKVETLFPEVE